MPLGNCRPSWKDEPKSSALGSVCWRASENRTNLMLAFLADENFNGDIFRGILRENAQVDLVRVQDVGLSGQSDPEVLRWAAENSRIVLTHDLASMPHFADDRVAQRLEMPGVITVRR